DVNIRIVHIDANANRFTCDLPVLLSFNVVDVPWFKGSVTNPSVQVAPNNGTAQYRFQGTLPSPSLNTNNSLDLDFGLFSVHNSAVLGIPIQETLDLDGVW